MKYRTEDVAESLWLYLAIKAGIPPQLRQKAWRALKRRPEVLTWRYTVQQALDAGAWRESDPLRTVARPAIVVGALEACVTRQWLSRKEVTTIEEALFRLMTKDGFWRHTRKARG